MMVGVNIDRSNYAEYVSRADNERNRNSVRGAAVHFDCCAGSYRSRNFRLGEHLLQSRLFILAHTLDAGATGERDLADHFCVFVLAGATRAGCVSGAIRENRRISGGIAGASMTHW